MKKVIDSYKKCNDTAGSACCWNGCEDVGKFPAPKSPENRKDLYYFCLQHIREYNNSWDFFRKMDMNQIDGFQKEVLTGHRPTWKFGVGDTRYNNIEDIKNQVFGEFRGTHKSCYKDAEGVNTDKRLPKPTWDALKILGLPYPITLQDLKKKYKKLAKEYHPDLNGHANDDKIKCINQAYSYLNSLDIFK